MNETTSAAHVPEATVLRGPWQDPALPARPDGVLEDLASRRLLPRDPVAVLSGGHGLHVVSRSAWPGHGAPDEMTYWLDRQVDGMLAKVTWTEFETGDPGLWTLTDAEEGFLGGLTTCRTLSGTTWVRGRRRALEESAFRAFVTTRSLAEADDALEDALDQLAAEEWDFAVLSAHKAFGHVVDALLESHGCYGLRTARWRAARLREVRPRQLAYEEYWAMETMAGFVPRAPEPWVLQVVERCRDLSIEVEIH